MKQNIKQNEQQYDKEHMNTHECKNKKTKTKTIE